MDVGSLCSTLVEWSSAERFVSGAAPNAKSPTVDVQSVPRFVQLRCFTPTPEILSPKECISLRFLTTWEVPVALLRLVHQGRAVRPCSWWSWVRR